VVPVGVHTWSNRTSEQPLSVLWAASVLHPERMAGVDVAGETGRFYREVFGQALEEAQVAAILGGGV
jgi:iron complex transport system substrate-binding protein